MDPITITANLRTPLIRNGYMTLDALLMAVLETDRIDHLIRCDDGLYHASAAILLDAGDPIKASYVASMRPQSTPAWLDVIQPNSNKGTDVAIGDSRMSEAGNVISSYEATPCRAVMWHAIGDRQAVIDVLRRVKFIGKKRATGYGEVIRWKAEDGTLDGIVGSNGEPLRPVPVSRWRAGGNPVVMEAAWKPPYWSIDNREKCHVPVR